MTLMMELKEQRREGYDEGRTKGRVENVVNNVRALMAKKGRNTICKKQRPAFSKEGGAFCCAFSDCRACEGEKGRQGPPQGAFLSAKVFYGHEIFRDFQMP